MNAIVHALRDALMDGKPDMVEGTLIFNDEEGSNNLKGLFFDGFAICHREDKPNESFVHYVTYPKMEDLNQAHFERIKVKCKLRNITDGFNYYDVAITFCRQSMLIL